MPVESQMINFWNLSTLVSLLISHLSSIIHSHLPSKIKHIARLTYGPPTLQHLLVPLILIPLFLFFISILLSYKIITLEFCGNFIVNTYGHPLKGSLCNYENNAIGNEITPNSDGNLLESFRHHPPKQLNASWIKSQSPTLKMNSTEVWASVSTSGSYHSDTLHIRLLYAFWLDQRRMSP